MTLPISRTVNVTVSKNDGFPSRRGFGVPLFLTSEEKAGKLDATNLTRVYGSIEEVAADFDTADDFYKAAVQAFAQNPRPIQIKAGYYDRSGGAPTVSEIQDAMNDIVEYDNDWYWLAIETPLRDTAELDGLVTWIETQNKQLIADSNDALHEDVNDATNISAANKGTVERTSVFYHDDATQYAGLALAAYLGTFNLDNANSHYTAKFKNLASVSPVNKGSAVVQAITGFTPSIGQSVAAGHCANTYVDIGGQNFVVEGSTLTPNIFIDEIHSTDWITARTEEAVLGVFLNNNIVPYTQVGMEMIASAIRGVMEVARRSGIVAADINPQTGDFESSVVITVPDVFDVPESQRKARIGPAIQVDFRYAGAVHYTTINYNVSF